MTVFGSGTGQIAMLSWSRAALDVGRAARRGASTRPPETAAQNVAMSLPGLAVSRQSSVEAGHASTVAMGSDVRPGRMVGMSRQGQPLARQYAAELTAMARDVIATNRYVVLGTVHPDGHPRVSPVYFNHHEHRAFYWVSSPDSQHSHNLAADPRMNAVVFDSSTPPAENRAVYLTGTAAEVPEADLEAEIPRAFAQIRQGRPRLHRRGALRRRRPPPLPPRRRPRRGPRPRRPPPLGPRHRHASAGHAVSDSISGMLGEQLVEDVGDGAGGEGTADGGVASA